MAGRPNDELLRVIDQFPHRKVLVIGDLMLDHYVWGTVNRISPEAPVPVVNVTSESIMLGGAANVLHNIIALGGRGAVCGVVGGDDAGRRVLEGLAALGADTRGIAVEGNRPTTRKTRIIAHNQQVVRFDQESKKSISAKTQGKIIDYLKEQSGELGAIVLSDYAKGVIGERLMEEILAAAGPGRFPIVVDPKIQNMSLYRGVTVVTPNHLEASQASGIPIEDETSLVQAGENILERLSCRAVLITRGEQGMSLFEAGGRITHVPTVAKQVYDVTGAGDTVVGTLALALASGADLADASRVANHAAGIVVGMVGTATASRAALVEALTC